MSYQNFGTKEILPDQSETVIQNYDGGYVFTRTKQGHMERVRSLRVNLQDFELSSENRRILRKYEHSLHISQVPYQAYSWQIHKMGKDFYDTKFGADTFSANKIKELFTTATNNFNYIISLQEDKKDPDGFCIIHVSAAGKRKEVQTLLTSSSIRPFPWGMHDVEIITELPEQKIAHYAYPFYKLDLINSSFGMYMMTKSIEYFKNAGFDYVYLGSVHEPASLYKLQFKGLEWFDERNESWSSNIEELKTRVRNSD